MDCRRIAIYLGSRTPIAKVQLNHKYTQKVDVLIFKTGDSKTEIARKLLTLSFQTDDISELHERILYAANVNKDELIGANIAVKRRIGEACKKALKLAIDKGCLL